MTNQVPVEIISISASQSSKNGYKLVLGELGGQRRLQLIVGIMEAQSIAVCLEKIVTARPLTHHFIQHILQDFEIALKYIQLYKYEEGIFYAYAYFEDSFGTIKYFDCRPSDALCLALKLEKPIFVLEELFQATQMIFANNGAKDSGSNKSIEDMTLLELEESMKKAVADENYELAIIIKEEIVKRTKN